LGIVLATGVPSLADDPRAPSADDLLDHAERPLRADDFRARVPDDRPRGEPPDELPIAAYSETDIRFRFDSRTRLAGRESVTRLTRIVFSAVVDRSRSWNAAPDDPSLLDHLQGHFDLTRLAAYDAQDAVRRRMASTPFEGRGSTERAAIEDLKRRILDECRSVREELAKDRAYFDKRTRYGTDRGIEREERNRQKERLRIARAGDASGLSGK